jgi:membrane-associated phospholipid phosphatase
VTTSPPTFPVRPWLVTGAAALLGFLLVTVLVLGSGRSDPLDRMASVTAASVRTSGMTEVAEALTRLGSWPVVLAVTAVAAGFAWERSGQFRRPATLLAVLLLTVSVVYLLKIAVGRPRPHALLVTSSSPGFAFPSGHATDATVVYVLAALLLTTDERRVRRALALATATTLALLVGLSRIWLGGQWASDVLAGWLLGAAITAFACAVLGSLSDPASTSTDPVERLPSSRAASPASDG